MSFAKGGQGELKWLQHENVVSIFSSSSLHFSLRLLEAFRVQENALSLNVNRVVTQNRNKGPIRARLGGYFILFIFLFTIITIIVETNAFPQ